MVSGRYPMLYNYIVGKLGSEDDSSSEDAFVPIRNLHNEYQALFVDESFLDRFVEDLFPGKEPLVENVVFEHLCNADIAIHAI